MDIKKSGQKASLKISQDVLETIARVAALEIEGVASIAEPQGNIRNMLSKGSSAYSIDTSLVDGIAEVSISLNLEFGARISDVCFAVQNNIKDNIQTMTGIMVSKVNVTIAGISFPSPIQNEE